MQAQSNSVQALISKTPAYGTVNCDDIHAVLDRPIIIDKPVTIRGGFFQEAVALSPMFDAVSEGVQFRSLRIAGSEAGGEWLGHDGANDRAAIRLSAANCKAEGCSIAGKATGVRVVANHADVLDNQIRGFLVGGRMHQLVSVAGDFCNISRNQLHDGGAGITCGLTLVNTRLCDNIISGTADNGIYLSSGRNVLVAGNVVYNTRGGSGIKCRGWSHTITKNNLYNLAGIGITLSGITGQDFGEVHGLKVNGYGITCSLNTIERTEWHGIYMDGRDGGYLSNTLLHGNVLSDCGRSTADQYAGIRVNGPLTQLVHNSISGVPVHARAAVECFNSPAAKLDDNILMRANVGYYIRTSPGVSVERPTFYEVEHHYDWE